MPHSKSPMLVGLNALTIRTLVLGKNQAPLRGYFCIPSDQNRGVNDITIEDRNGVLDLNSCDENNQDDDIS
jgi:hypothetical protein